MIIQTSISIMKFKDVLIGAKFNCNGMTCVKKSSRTAWVCVDQPQASRWFYFGKNEFVRVV